MTAGSAITNSSPSWARSTIQAASSARMLSSLDQLWIDARGDRRATGRSARVLEQQLTSHFDARTVDFDHPRVPPDRVAKREAEHLSLTRRNGWLRRNGHDMLGAGAGRSLIDKRQA